MNTAVVLGTMWLPSLWYSVPSCTAQLLFMKVLLLRVLRVTQHNTAGSLQGNWKIQKWGKNKGKKLHLFHTPQPKTALLTFWKKKFSFILFGKERIGRKINLLSAGSFCKYTCRGWSWARLTLGETEINVDDRDLSTWAVTCCLSVCINQKLEWK